ncbi:hypothetical protein ACJIZ3_016413 [Penstemon smallii]|uniref:Uncharacterized protein n=1 Tax=Penstemon smallii TaxID=265156 RepID=A0ABD3RUV4_9LAMI
MMGYVKMAPSADLNRNTEWFTYPGVWITYISILFFSWLIVLSVTNCTPGMAWTIVNLCHFMVTYHFFHWKKGTPFGDDQGVYNGLTWWEQMDNGKQLTRNRKFITVVPMVLYLIASHTTDYQQPMLSFNTLALIVLAIAKFPNMHKATVASNGRPANRTVVYRGFQDDSDKIQINTDNRSRKICWYFTESWEQFRISGHVDVIDGTNPDPTKLQQREKSWFACSPRSRLQYVGPTPKLPSLSEQPSQISSLDPSIGPVDAFCLLILDPDQVDYLNLKSNERLIFTSGPSSGGEKFWTSERVNP